MNTAANDPQSDLQGRFQAVDALLRADHELWSAPPFKLLRLPWEADHPELVRELDHLSDGQLREYEEHPARARRFLARWLPRQADRSARVEPAELGGKRTLDPTLAAGVPARKWQQLEAFIGNLPDARLPVLEWCSGKGHLARLLAELDGRAAFCVERDDRLAHLGRRIAEERELPIDFAVLDALSEAAGQAVTAEQLACALHACGELHVRLIELAIERRTRALAISPCCYHLTPAATIRPLSTPARSSQLELTREQARLALQEAVTAAPAVRRRRERQAAWRLGFDVLQRELRGCDEYLPVPSIDEPLDSFAAFVHWAAGRKQLELPAELDLTRHETHGRERLDQVRRRNLVRHLFRRPLEMWIVLDRALGLEEAGYQVDLGVFCDRRITPRNLMIRATRA